MTRARRGGIAAAAVTLMLAFAGCSSPSADGGSSSADTDGGSTAASESGYPVSIENCGRTLTFDSAPERVVTLWQAPTEMLIDLGVQDHVVAMAGNYADFPDSLADAAKAIPEIGTSMSWPSKETLLSESPDLVIGQSLSGYAFDTSQGYASVEQIEEGGAQVYGASMCDADGGDAVDMKMDTTIQTLRDLGAMFDVSDRAEKIISELEADRQTVVDAVEDQPTVKTAFYNGGEGPLIVLAGGIYDDAISTAGGENVFPKDSVYVSKEEFAASAADVILVGTFTGQDFDTLRDYLESTFPDLPAVQQGRIVEVPVDDTDASVTVMRGLTQIANGLHPDLDLPVPSV